MARNASPKPIRLKITRHVAADGRQVPAGTPGAKKVVERSRLYYVRLTVDGQRRTVPLGTDSLTEAWRRLGEIVAQQTAPTDTHADRPLSAHLADWRQAVLDSGTLPRVVHDQQAQLAVLADLAGWKTLADLTADSLRSALASLTREGRSRTRKGISAQTRNHYARHARQFAKWCVEGKRLTENPFAGVKSVRVDADRRHDRRVLTAPEMATLFAYLHGDDAPVRRGMTGMERAMGYKVALATGLRGGELRSLTRQSFDLDNACVSVRAAYTKNRKRTTLPLPAWLVVDLLDYFAAGHGCWERFRADYVGSCLRADMTACGVAWSVPGPDGPLFADMHALRHTFVSALASQPGIDIKTLMELARHSTPTLTLKVYAHAREEMKRAAVEEMPRPDAVPQLKLHAG